MKIRFLLDECESARLKTALLRFDPAIDVLRVGEPGAPHLETLDPDILRYLEVAQRLLVTSNRASSLLTWTLTGLLLDRSGECCGSGPGCHWAG